MSMSSSMSSSPLIRLGAISAAIGSTLLIITHILDPLVGSPLPEASTLGLVLALAFTAHVPLFAVAVAVAVVGLHLGQSDRSGRFDLLSTVLALVGLIAMAGPAWNGLFVGPVLRAEAPALAEQDPALTMAGGLVSLVLYALGLLLFAIATWRAGVLPRPAAALVAAGLVLAIPLEGAFPAVLVLYPVGMAWLGIAALRTTSPALHPANA